MMPMSYAVVSLTSHKGKTSAAYPEEARYACPYRIIRQLSPTTLVHHRALVSNATEHVHSYRNEGTSNQSVQLHHPP
jgi:hypothetical protein